jgi:hypothetical protein
MRFTTTLFGLAALTASVAAHGNVTSPPARQPGPAMAAACGQDAVAAIEADGTGPLENIPSNGDANCNIFLCKGAQFADNRNKVQNFTAGQVINFKADIPIPHEGPANVSIIDTKTNTAIGEPLITFASYADEKLAKLPANNTNFNVTMPADLGTSCQVAGECVMQWFWFGTSAQQTYENCVDFVMV